MIISNFIDLVCESLFERIERIFVVINLISRRETLGYLRSDSVNAGESCFRVVHEVSFERVFTQLFVFFGFLFAILFNGSVNKNKMSQHNSNSWEN